IPGDQHVRGSRSTRLALVLFCAEQGFAGAFSERVLDAARGDLAAHELFLVGTRGVTAAAERNVVPRWKARCRHTRSARLSSRTASPKRSMPALPPARSMRST